MKTHFIKIVLLIFCWVISMHLLMAQQGGFHYQAALRDASGGILANKEVQLRISIGEGTNVFFEENHQVTTNSFGILNLSVGANAGGGLAEVPWGMPGLSMQIELNDGSGFRTLGRAPMMPVPYALFAGEAENMNFSIEEIQLTEEGELTFVLDDQRIFNVGNVTGPTGEKGEVGPVGPQGPQGAQGPAGRDGTGIQIIGSIASEADLDVNHPGDEGDLVIIAATGAGFVWDGTNWVAVGNIRGPEGAIGPEGPQGNSRASGSSGTSWSRGNCRTPRITR